MTNENNSTAGAVHVEANLQEQLSDHLHFSQEMATEALTYGEMCSVSFSSHMNLRSSHLNGRFMLWVSLRMARELYSEYNSTRTRHTCMSVRRGGKVSIRIFDLR